MLETKRKNRAEDSNGIQSQVAAVLDAERHRRQVLTYHPAKI